MRKMYISARLRLCLALFVSSIVSIGLYFAGRWGSHEHDFAYMIWNLTLAWSAMGMTFWLEWVLHRRLWSSWYALIITLLWVLFIPNTFYMVTDFIHIAEVPPSQLLYGTIMFTSFIVNGMILGFLSLYIVHRELVLRVSRKAAHSLIALTILTSSFAIYIGRELRWNSWDILVNPMSLLFDITDRLLFITQHTHMVVTTISFFALIGSFYTVMWHVVRAMRGREA